MAGKGRKKTGPCWRKRKIVRRLQTACRALDEGRPDAAVNVCRHLLRHVEPGSSEDVDVLLLLGLGLMMKRQFRPAWEVFTLALNGSPFDPEIWYNRALAGRRCFRLVGSMLDLERARELATDPQFLRELRPELSLGRRLVRAQLAERGEGFTLKLLLEVEQAFQKGMDAVIDHDFKQAAAFFQEAVDKDRDCQPGAWGFLGMCLMMDRRFEAAERALAKALEIDPADHFAQVTLEMLPQARSFEQPLSSGIDHLLTAASSALSAR